LSREAGVLKFVARESKPEAATKETYTYGHYLTWLDDERWELIDGVPYDMTPAPSRLHQKISTELIKQIAVYLTGKTCEVYAAPFDVRLPKGDEEDEKIMTVVQPDLVVVCDPKKLDERGCKGAPGQRGGCLFVLETTGANASRSAKVDFEIK
jgi:hypothetical protein